MIRIREKAIVLRIWGSDYDEMRRLRSHFKFRPTNYWRSPSYERFKITGGEEGWDGHIYPFKIEGDDGLTATLGRGYKDELLEACRKKRIEVDGRDLIESPFAHLELEDVPADLFEGVLLDDYQRRGVWQWLKHCVGICNVTVSGGKCLGRGTPVMLSNGDTVPVEAVKPGDKLMGPDSKPRSVKSTTVGRGQLYRVDQINGDSYVTNGDHILALVKSYRKGNFYGPNTRYVRENVIMTVEQFTALPPTTKKLYTGYKAGLSFKHKKVPIDPYFLGLWLGDGTSGAPAVTTNDASIVAYLEEFARQYDCILTPLKSSDRCPSYYISSMENGKGHLNPVRKLLKRLGVYGKGRKRIPQQYLRNSRKVRTALLAGLMDSDGHVKRKGQIELTSTLSGLAEDYLWLLRSLGLRASLKPKRTTCQTGAKGAAYRVTGTGDFSDLNCLLPHKNPGCCLKGGLRTAISIIPLEHGDYYGFELDGDRLFLLGDFTVTHNTLMFAAAARMIKDYHSEARILYITQSERLVRQAYDEMIKRMPDLHITRFGGGSKKTKSKKLQPGNDSTGKDMVVATTAMLRRNHLDLIKKGWYRTFSAIFYDEVHHAPAKTSQAVLEITPALYRFGASDTRKEGDPSKWNAILSHFGPMRAETPASPLIQKDRIARPNHYLVDIDSWQNKFQDLPYQAEPETDAMVLQEGAWKKAVFVGPVYETDDKGNIVYKKVRELDDDGEWVTVKKPVIIPGVRNMRIDGKEEAVESRWCLLERSYDRAIIRFKSRNDLIVQWASHFAQQGHQTLVVCTRTLHIYILEALLKASHPKPENVDILFGWATSSARDEAFDWFRSTPGSILITPLVKEGVSINEIRAGVVADHVADWEVANQIAGRFMRKKPGGRNEAEIVWFVDRQHPRMRRNNIRVFTQLEQISGYNFYHPVHDPASLKHALEIKVPDIAAG